MSLFGVGLDIEVKRINTQFKMQIQKKNGTTLRQLATIFKRMDVNGNKTLDKEEFTQALAAFGLFPKKHEIQALIKYYDTDGDSSISYQEFVKGLRDPLPDRRLRMVKKAFALMDKEGSNKITVEDIGEAYDVTQNRDFMQGLKSREEVLYEFLAGFEELDGIQNGTITWEDFLGYYTDVSMNIIDDSIFVQMMESIWNVAEDEEASVQKDQLEYLTKILRQKLRDFSRSSTEENVLRSVFKEFDVSKSGNLTIDELAMMLTKLQIICDRKYVTALFKKFDVNGNGVVEFEEFCDYIIRNPYR